MKLVRQARLHYQQGKSDKVYEIDLCEVGPDQFVVNFRYGRRGAALRDGSKTPLSVDRARAEALYDKLYAEKTGKGYVDITSGSAAPAPAPSPPPASPPPAPTDLSPRERRVLRYLRRKGEAPHAWPRHRIARRAGQMRLTAGVPALITLAADPDPRKAFDAVWALARMRDPEALQALQGIATGRTTEPLRRAADEGIRAQVEGDARVAFEARVTERLPAALRRALDDPAALPVVLQTWLTGSPEGAGAAIADLYLLDRRPSIRSVVLGLTSSLPLAPPTFRAVRYLFKAAELRGDGAVFGPLVRRFEREAPMYSASRWWDSAWTREIGTFKPSQEVRRSSPRVAFSRSTKTWLRRRAWRTLRKLGGVDSPDYVALATGVLLAYDDDDAQEPRVTQSWDYDGVQQTRHWDTFAPQWVLGGILFSNSPRYTPRPRRLVWGCRDWTPGSEPPRVREEAFPHLWDRAPEALLTLLRQSRCAPVQHFAARTFRIRRGDWGLATTPILFELLASPYEPTRLLAADIAVAAYDPASPDLPLVQALATCGHAPARAAAMGWIRAQPGAFVPNLDLVVALAVCAHGDTRAALREILTLSSPTDARAAEIVGALIGAVLALPALTADAQDADAGAARDAQRALCRDVADLFAAAFPAASGSVDVALIHSLLAHPALGPKEVGARLCLARVAAGHDLDDELLADLLTSPAAELRAIGMRVFSRLSDDVLLERRLVLLHLAGHPDPALRAAARPIVARLAPGRPAFAASFLGLVVGVLGAPAEPEVHADLVALARESLPVTQLGEEAVWTLLESPSSVVQELGGELLEGAIDPAGLALERLVALAHHDVLAVREAGRALCTSQADRLRADPDHAVRLLDTDWDDTRAFAYRFFEDAMAPAFSPPLLVAVCDSVRPEVQQFGRGLITRTFADADGPEYLLKLSEHPATDMQLFATNWLDAHAAGDLDALRRLRHYFAAVLGAVHRGRISKQRVLAFLRAEIERGPAFAAEVAAVADRLSASVAVEDRAAAIELLTTIREAAPEVEHGLRITPFPRRSGRTRYRDRGA